MTSLVFFYNEKEGRISESFVIIFSYSHVQILKPVTGKYESHGQNPIVLYATVHKIKILPSWIDSRYVFFHFYFADLFTRVNDIHYPIFFEMATFYDLVFYYNFINNYKPFH